tara:strand:- start:4611 stop:4979 length:369 start_codon:yes stop_codon:yes gene_type:complete
MKVEVELGSDYADRIVIASLKKSLSYLSAGDDDLRRCIMQSLSFYLSAEDFAVFERSLSDEDIEEALREQARVRHLEFFGDPKEKTLEWKAADEIQRLRNLIDELTQKRYEEEIVSPSRFDG